METATTERKSIAIGGARLVEANMSGNWWYRSVSRPMKRRCSKGTQRHWVCDNLINALMLLANQQKDGDSPIQSIVTGLHESSRRGIMDGLRSFIEADNHSAVDVGDLRRGTITVDGKKPQFSETFPRGGHQRRRRRVNIES